MIVVTGSNGFIGSNLIKNLNSLGISEILAIDNHDNEALQENIKNCKIKEYLGIEEFLTSIKKREIDSSKIKAIFHQGACSDTMEWDAEYLFQNNLTVKHIGGQFHNNPGIAPYCMASRSI